MSLWIKKKKPKKTTAKNERFFMTSIIFVIFNVINNLYINKINKTKKKKTHNEKKSGKESRNNIKYLDISASELIKILKKRYCSKKKLTN